MLSLSALVVPLMGRLRRKLSRSQIWRISQRGRDCFRADIFVGFRNVKCTLPGQFSFVAVWIDVSSASWFHHNFVSDNRVWRNPNSNGTLSWDDSGPPERRTIFDNHVSIWSISCFQLHISVVANVPSSALFWGRAWREIGESHNYLFLLLSLTRGVWLVAHESVPRRRLCIPLWNKGKDVVATRRQFEIDWAVAPLPTIR